MLPRSTTPDIRYKFNKVQVSDITECYLSFAQREKKLLEKDLSEAIEINTEENYIQWRLTQAETAKFTTAVPVEVQIKFKTSAGIVSVSKISKVPSYRNWKEEEI